MKSHAAVRLIAISATLAWVNGVSIAVAAPVPALRIVALSGQPPAGTDSSTQFQRFDAAPIINEGGQVAFFAAPEAVPGEPFGGHASVWSEQSNGLGLVVRRGDLAPGLGLGTHFDRFFDLAFNNVGHTAFRADLAGSAVDANNLRSIWREAAADLSLVARQGDQAPGTPDGTVYEAFFTVPALNDQDELAFYANIRASTPGASLSSGLWTSGPSGGQLVAAAGSNAPGTPSDILFSAQSFESPFGDYSAINDLGQTTFLGFVEGPSVEPETNAGIWSTDANDALQIVVRNGDPAPGTDSLRFLSFTSPPAVNNLGHWAALAFLAPDPTVTIENRIGLWADRGNDLELVVRLGDQAPGLADDVRFADFAYPIIDGRGGVAFNSVLVGDQINPTNQNSLWSEGIGGPGNLRLVAQAGSHAPGTEAGTEFRVFLAPTMNARGQIAFLAGLNGPSVSEEIDNVFGLWARDIAGELHLIARDGDQIQLAPNDIRTIDYLLFASGTGGQEGRASGLNDIGQVAFVAHFTDGTNGVFVSSVVATVPEPRTLIPALFMVLLAISLSTLRERVPRYAVNLFPLTLFRLRAI